MSASASGQSYWTGGALGFNYKWDTGSNWFGGARPGTGATVIFNNRNGIGTMVSPMSMQRDFNWNSVTFSNINNRLPATLDINANDSGNSARTLTLSGSITLADTSTTVRFNANNFGVMNIALSNNNTFSTSLSSTLILNPIISGAFGITKTGTGTLVLGGVNTYSGLTTINGGTLSYATSNAIAAAGVTVNSTGTLALNGFSDSVGQVIVDGGSITGTGTLSSTANFDVRSGSSSAVLGGAVGLTKSTAGTFTLFNANAYTGQTTINAGTLSYGASNAILAGGVTVNSTGTLAINGFSDTVGQVIVDGGSITGTGTLSSTTNFDVRSGLSSAILGGTVGLNKSTAGSFTLSNANTYTGQTTVNAGTLSYGANNAIGAGAVTVNSSGTLALNGFNDTVGLVIVAGGSITGTGTLSSTANFDVRSGSSSAILGGTTGLTKSTAGSFTLSNANTYTGTTSVYAGTLVLGHATNSLNDSGAVVVNGGTLMLGNNNDTVGNVTLINGSISGTGGKLGSSSFQLENGTVTAKLSGVGSLTKTTTGIVTLSNSNDYIGNTNVSSGTLIISTLGSINSYLSTFNATGGLTRIDAGGVVNVNQVNLSGNATMAVNGTLNATSGIVLSNTAVLKGNGQINSALTLATGAQLAPGNSIGHLTMNSLALAGNYSWEVASGTNSADLVDVTSTLDLTGASLSIIETGTFSIGQKFTLFSYGLFAPSQFTGWSNGSVQGGWRINYFDTAPGLNGGSGLGYVSLTSVPEPTALFLGVIGLCGIAAKRRRREF